MNAKRRREIVADIKYELLEGTHTFTMCKCGRHGSRSGRCWECFLEELEMEK